MDLENCHVPQCAKLDVSSRTGIFESDRDLELASPDFLTTLHSSFISFVIRPGSSLKKDHFTMATTQEEDPVPPNTEDNDAPQELSEPAQDGDSVTDPDNSREESENEGGASSSKNHTKVSEEHGEVEESEGKAGASDAPPLPDEAIPPLPAEAPPGAVEQDDGWAPIWDETAQAFYFYNRFTGLTQWSNPRVPEASVAAPPRAEKSTAQPNAPVAGGYNPAIHGDYDPTAWYAQSSTTAEEQAQASSNPTDPYAATAAFNRFTGRFQNPDLTPENFNDDNKSRRQLNAFFDVDAAANNHDGRSLKEERSGKKLSKAELKWHKEKRKARKEEKRRAWLRD